MHFCFIMTSRERYSPVSGGAIATYTMQYARRLIARGHRVSVLTPTVDETYQVGDIISVRTESRESVNILQHLMSVLSRRFHHWDRRYYEHYLHSSLAALQRMAPAPDVVIVFNDFVLPMHVKRILHSVRIILRLSNEKYTRQKARINEITDSVYRFVAVSDYIRDWAIREYRIPACKLLTIPNGADTTTFVPRDDYLESTGQLRVLFLGRLIPEKGPDIVADAVAALQAEGLPVSLTVAGAVWWYGKKMHTVDPFTRLMHKKIGAVGAQYLGHVPRPQVPALIRDHDVLCVLSRWNEPMAQTVFEGMASGCVVIASNRGGLPQGCGEGAMIVDPDDFDSVVDILRSLATDRNLLHAQKRQALAQALRSTWDIRVDEFLKVVNT